MAKYITGNPLYPVAHYGAGGRAPADGKTQSGPLAAGRHDQGEVT